MSAHGQNLRGRRTGTALEEAWVKNTRFASAEKTTDGVWFFLRSETYAEKTPDGVGFFTQACKSISYGNIKRNALIINSAEKTPDGVVFFTQYPNDTMAKFRNTLFFKWLNFIALFTSMPKKWLLSSVWCLPFFSLKGKMATQLEHPNFFGYFFKLFFNTFPK
jgi:hypothetical protein